MVQQNIAEKCYPGKEREAGAKSSRLSRHARPDQARRRSWRRRAQDSGSQIRRAKTRADGKPIRLNRVPLLRAETSSPSTSAQEVSGLSQAVGLVTSRSSSLPCQKQGLKRGHPQGDTEPESPPAKRRRMEDMPAQSAGITSQVALRLSQDVQSPRQQTLLYRPPWILPRSQAGPIRVRRVLRQERREKKPYSRPENQSRPR